MATGIDKDLISEHVIVEKILKNGAYLATEYSELKSAIARINRPSINKLMSSKAENRMEASVAAGLRSQNELIGEASNPDSYQLIGICCYVVADDFMHGLSKTLRYIYAEIPGFDMSPPLKHPDFLNPESNPELKLDEFKNFRFYPQSESTAVPAARRLVYVSVPRSFFTRSLRDAGKAIYVGPVSTEEVVLPLLSPPVSTGTTPTSTASDGGEAPAATGGTDTAPSGPVSLPPAASDTELDSLFKAHGKSPAEMKKMWGRLSKRAKKHMPCAQKIAPLFGGDPCLVLAVAATESAFVENAESGTGAYGMMQFIKSTYQTYSTPARRQKYATVGVNLTGDWKTDLYNPCPSITMATDFLHDLYLRAKSKPHKACGMTFGEFMASPWRQSWLTEQYNTGGNEPTLRDLNPCNHAELVAKLPLSLNTAGCKHAQKNYAGNAKKIKALCEQSRGHGINTAAYRDGCHKEYGGKKPSEPPKPKDDSDEMKIGDSTRTIWYSAYVKTIDGKKAAMWAYPYVTAEQKAMADKLKVEEKFVDGKHIVTVNGKEVTPLYVSLNKKILPIPQTQSAKQSAPAGSKPANRPLMIFSTISCGLSGAVVNEKKLGSQYIKVREDIRSDVESIKNAFNFFGVPFTCNLVDPDINNRNLSDFGRVGLEINLNKNAGLNPESNFERDDFYIGPDKSNLLRNKLKIYGVVKKPLFIEPFKFKSFSGIVDVYDIRETYLNGPPKIKKIFKQFVDINEIFEFYGFIQAETSLIFYNNSDNNTTGWFTWYKPLKIVKDYSYKELLSTVFQNNGESIWYDEDRYWNGNQFLRKNL